MRSVRVNNIMRYNRALWIGLTSLFIFPASVLAACTQTTISISPSVSDVANDSGGMLSAGWHEGSLVFKCYGVGMYKSFYNDILVNGTASGEEITFEGVSYDLYKTGVDDVFYFGYLSGMSMGN